MTDAPLTDAQRRFIAAHPHAAMITLGRDGRPKAVMVEAAVVDGRLESASHADKVRTRRLRGEPRCTLYFADDEFRWLTVEADTTIVDDDSAPSRLLAYFRIRDGKPTEPLDYHSDRSDHRGLDDDGFRRVMAEERAVLYEFAVTATYGNVAASTDQA